jgi:hypothetical protein
MARMRTWRRHVVRLRHRLNPQCWSGLARDSTCRGVCCGPGSLRVAAGPAVPIGQLRHQQRVWPWDGCILTGAERQAYGLREGVRRSQVERRTHLRSHDQPSVLSARFEPADACMTAATALLASALVGYDPPVATIFPLPALKPEPILAPAVPIDLELPCHGRSPSRMARARRRVPQTDLPADRLHCLAQRRCGHFVTSKRRATLPLLEFLADGSTRFGARVPIMRGGGAPRRR